MNVLAFDVAGVRYAVALESVREIVRAVAVTPLPKAPRVIAGVIDFRGTTVPVFDLRARFGAPARELDPAERFIVARTARRTVALRVDGVEWIREVPEGEVREMAELTPGSPYVTGVARVSDGLLFIHDLETFLSAAEAHDLEDSLTARNSGGAG